MRAQHSEAAIDNALKAKRCQDFFKDNCTAGALDSARKAFDAATVSLEPDKSNTFGTSMIRNAASEPTQIGYNLAAYKIGRWEIAATLLHELFHTCRLTRGTTEEILAEQATEQCGFYAPWITRSTPQSVSVGDTMTVNGYQFGQAQDNDHYLEFGGSKITSYDKWEQASGASNVTIEFKVPATYEAAIKWPVDLVNFKVVNHGHASNTKSVMVRD